MLPHPVIQFHYNVLFLVLTQLPRIVLTFAQNSFRFRTHPSLSCWTWTCPSAPAWCSGSTCGGPPSTSTCRCSRCRWSRPKVGERERFRQTDKHFDIVRRGPDPEGVLGELPLVHLLRTGDHVADGDVLRRPVRIVVVGVVLQESYFGSWGRPGGLKQSFVDIVTRSCGTRRRG